MVFRVVYISVHLSIFSLLFSLFLHFCEQTCSLFARIASVFGHKCGVVVRSVVSANVCVCLSVCLLFLL